MLRTLLAKHGYFLSFSNKFILNEPGYSGMLLISVKRLQHGANDGFADGKTNSFYRTPFEVTQMVKPFRRGVNPSSSFNMFMLDEVVVVVGRTAKCQQVQRSTLLPDDWQDLVLTEHKAA